MRRVGKKAVIAAAMFAIAWVNRAYAIVGVGAHWGPDFSLSMKDKFGEVMEGFSLKLSVADIPFLDQSKIPDDLSDKLNATLTGKDIPLYVDRYNWNNGNGRFNPIAFGGKAFVDIIPFVDAVEASYDFAMWEYDGALIYPIGMSPNALNAATVPQLFAYDTLRLTLGEAGMPSIMGYLDGTPYLKMRIDLTVRKNLVALPPKMKILRIYAGGGMNMHIATPVLSTGLIRDAIDSVFDNPGDMFSSLSVTNNPAQLAENQQELQKAVMKKIVDNLNKVHTGMHIVAGTMLKLPLIPLGVYVDGKFMIPFGQLDDYVDIGGVGFVINAGVAFAL